MQRYAGRVAMVTGASSGIGAAITRALLRHGLTVVGVDLQPDRMEAWELNDAKGKLYPRYCDVSNEESVVSAFKWTLDNLGGVDILINSAGVFFDASLTGGATKDWRHTLDVNVLGLSICTREAVQGMLSRGVEDGFIIHICSLAAYIPPHDPQYAMYFGSKTAVRVLLDGLRKDLLARNSRIRVGEVSPALVKTEIMKNVSEDNRALWDSPCLQPDDVAQAVLYMLSQEPHVMVSDVIIRATGSLH
ncbi:dehydrogenase/reductase SDR family member 11-like [Schistocerca serialis cubense]|uniref:dehydrogenase/reductase SDR family member 11-like n=1 Tax=Schistocerca serialis cubense TaxID=2023355 RepID=UPI00214E99CF|nr:dehydrogenase/reductase SDR family member 11-like [Schistocerca serialis cubense]